MRTVAPGLQPWKKGQSGNPGGRPRGERLVTTLVRELDRAGTREKLARTLIRMALGGDIAAMREIFLRVDGAVLREARIDHRVGQVITIVWGDELGAAQLAAGGGGGDDDDDGGDEG